jgi:hypothetical protein
LASFALNLPMFTPDCPTNAFEVFIIAISA